MTRLEFIVVFLIVFALAMEMCTSMYLEKRKMGERLVKEHIENSLRIAGKKLDKSKMYYFSKKANKITVMDNPNTKEVK